MAGPLMAGPLMAGPVRTRLLARGRAVADRSRSLTARLVLTAVVLALAVSVLLGTATTLVMRHALTDRLESEVQSTLGSVLETPPTPPGVEQQTRVDLRNLAPGTLIALLEPDTDPQAIVVGEGRGERDSVDDRVAERLAGVDTDGRVEEVSLGRAGHYLVAATTVGESTVLVGLPTRDVDDAVSQLLLAEVLLGLRPVDQEATRELPVPSRLEEALALTRVALTLNDDEPEAHFAQLAALRGLGRYQEALDALETLTALANRWIPEPDTGSDPTPPDALARRLLNEARAILRDAGLEAQSQTLLHRLVSLNANLAHLVQRMEDD